MHYSKKKPLPPYYGTGFKLLKARASVGFAHQGSALPEGVMMNRLFTKTRGFLAAALALLFCPCHLIITLPLVLSLLGGTVLGGFLRSHMGFLLAVSLVFFVAATAFAFRCLTDRTSRNHSNRLNVRRV